MEENQIILVDKPAGISSFGVVAKVRGYMRAKFGHKIKVGHTGTLDPFATGLLIILTGKMTKRSDEFLKKDKEYIATLRLGAVSSTGDPEGEIRPYPDLGTGRSRPSLRGSRPHSSVVTSGLPQNRDVVESTIQGFVGEIEQRVPKFSAVKINGERAYKLARKGADFETPTRKVTIYNIEILEYNYPELKIKTKVSSGTYIRTLAEDIGEKLGVGAYLTELRRTKIADYSVDEALPLSDFQQPQSAL
ncbi:tRNA pseudouridine(55) synthase TruB [Candidatus Saccharibacteria bacterium]|nr:tRNA pseudouridine(55) synthase TruB [Candidatus Saccharibacteria bacterium]